MPPVSSETTCTAVANPNHGWLATSARKLCSGRTDDAAGGCGRYAACGSNGRVEVLTYTSYGSPPLDVDVGA